MREETLRGIDAQLQEAKETFLYLLEEEEADQDVLRTAFTDMQRCARQSDNALAAILVSHENVYA